MTERIDIEAIPPPDVGERPLRELFVELWENTERLVRQELELTMSELDVRVGRMKKELVSAAIGGAVLYAGMLTLLAAVVLLLSRFMTPWVAALIVGAVAAVSGFTLIQKSKEDVEPKKLVPERSVRNIKRDVQMFKEATK